MVGPPLGSRDGSSHPYLERSRLVGTPAPPPLDLAGSRRLDFLQAGSLVAPATCSPRRLLLPSALRREGECTCERVCDVVALVAVVLAEKDADDALAGIVGDAVKVVLDREEDEGVNDAGLCRESDEGFCGRHGEDDDAARRGTEQGDAVGGCWSR